MKFETCILRGLFLACSLLGLLILGAMIHAKPQAPALGDQIGIAARLLAAPNACALPADGVLCLRHG